MRLFAQLTSVLILALIMSGCGDTYRPVVIPNPPPTPDPKPAHNLFVISNNGSAKGTGMQVNVSGDTNMGVIPLGIAPVHASLSANGGRVLSANFLNDTVSLIAPASSFGGISKVADVVFPTGFGPSFVTTTETGAFYVVGAGASPRLAFVSGTSNVVVDIEPLPGSSAGTMLSMAETPDAHKLYVASSNANSVIPVNPVDRTFNPALAVPTPVWVSARSDSQRAYVLSQATGALTEINPVDDSVVPNSVAAGVGANYMFYESHLNRLYITNPSGGHVTVASAAGDQAVQLGTLTSFPLAPRVDSVDDPDDPSRGHQPLSCSGSVQPLSTVALNDGSRIYVAGKFVGSCTNANQTVTCVASTIGQPSTASVCLQFTVFMANNFAVRSSVAVPPLAITAGSSAGVCDATRFRVTTAASADSLKVYLGTCDGGGVAVIRTDTDQFANFVSAPPSAAPPPVPGGAPPPQNPVFVLPGQ